MNAQHIPAPDRLPGQVLHPLPCAPTIAADHATGEEAASLTVTVSESCTAVAYDPQQLQTRATQLLATPATRTFGAGYVLAGTVQVTVSKAIASPTSPQVVLTFTGVGTCAYTLTAHAQQHLKTLLAGQPRLTALRWLLQQPGIHTASISGIADNHPLPDDLSHIRLLIVVLLF